VDFPDNQACLDLIEGKPTGILALLDEQCLFPKGNDESLANKLYEILAKEGALLTASKAERVAFKFAVRHYAGNVVYTSAGFCSKNKDELRCVGCGSRRHQPHER
jgi:myosin-5